jgi:HEAT repeat protein
MLQELLLLLEDRSALLRHEVCYAIGQTGMVKAAPVLVAILQNTRSLLSWETCATCYIAIFIFLF